ncbi:bacteria like putative lipoprotein [Rhodovulum sp. PH10]|uniref:lysozyme inhibitor LprI family protein n=1 Tax=Rhodovulum sp. PH10 TaxID=1187851 RepID=UPI00027C2E04|nr:hypothetical protein [Rhodovulum sp. PH10]EJW09907.1 bacteria like putative lipoprotein [Rhodovulum sp. PH10]
MRRSRSGAGLPTIPLACVLGTLFALAGPAGAAQYAPIDCKKAETPADRTVCGNYAPGQDEARMATLYGIATSLVAMGQRGDIEDAQRAFIRDREACGADVACLKRVYATRIGQLDEVIADIASRGPY